MRLAYIIGAHKLPAQLERLVNRLNEPEHRFLIHVDRKERATAIEVRGRLAGRANVSFLEPNDCHWGDAGHVRSAIKGLRELRDAEYDYAIFITGQDYPLKSNAEIAERLADADGHAFLTYHPLPWDGPPEQGPPFRLGGFERIECWHFHPGGRHVPFPLFFPNNFVPVELPFYLPPIKRRFPRGFVPYIGSAYWMFPREVIDYLLGFIDKRPKFVRFFERVHIPDEMLFQTILLNSPLRDRIVNDDLHLIDWTAGHPKIWTIEDLPRLEASDALFARKFDSEIDSRVLDVLDLSQQFADHMPPS